MRVLTLPLRCVLLVVALTASAFAWAQPYGYSINSRGDFVDDSQVWALWRINLATGQEQYIGWTGRGDFVDIEGLAFGPDGRLFGADDSTNTLVRIGTESGNAIPVGGSSSNMGVPLGVSMDFGLTFTCEGDLLVSAAGTGELYSADPETGRLSLLGNLGLPIVDLASVGDTVYGLGLGTDRDGRTAIPHLYRIDPGQASAELIGPLGNGASPYNQAGLAADEEGTLWAITDRNRVFGDTDTEARPSEILRIDAETGSATRIAETIVGIESLAITVPSECGSGNDRDEHGEGSEPEPIPFMSDAGRWLLVLLLAGLAVFRLRPVQS
jgi:opacity protein-like surface antigen